MWVRLWWTCRATIKSIGQNMTIDKARIIENNISDAINSINPIDDGVNKDNLKRKLNLINIDTALALAIEEKARNECLMFNELQGIKKQLEVIVEIRNHGFLDNETEKLESWLLGKKEELELALNEFPKVTQIELSEELLTEVMSWND